MRIGLIFIHFVPMKVAENRKRLIQKRQGLILTAEKFSTLHNNKLAAASNPTTTGRRPPKTACTIGVFIYFKNILLMSIIIISEGSMIATVAMTLPKIEIPVPQPAFSTAVYPQKVAALIPTGPGVICDTATMSVNSAELSQ